MYPKRFLPSSSTTWLIDDGDWALRSDCSSTKDVDHLAAPPTTSSATRAGIPCMQRRISQYLIAL